MFYLPREIVQLIFEFAPAYIEEYNKILKVFDRLPEYYNSETCSHYILYKYRFSYLSGDPPSKYYFRILKNLNITSSMKIIYSDSESV